MDQHYLVMYEESYQRNWGVCFVGWVLLFCFFVLLCFFWSNISEVETVAITSGINT